MDEEFKAKLIAELHDIALSLRAMSGRNVVKTNEPPKKEGYVARYFAKSDAGPLKISEDNSR